MYIVHRSTYLDEVSVTFCPDEVGLLDPELWGLHIKLVSMKLNHCISPCLAFSGAPNTNLCISYHLVLNRAWVWNLKLPSGAVCSIEKSSRVPIRTYNFKIRFEHELFFTKKKASTYSYIFELGYSMGKKSWNTDAHWLQTPSEETAFTARPKIHSHSQIVANFQISLIYAFIGCP